MVAGNPIDLIAPNRPSRQIEIGARSTSLRWECGDGSC
jgi:hypothetical protein